jgi:hypothetical protein
MAARNKKTRAKVIPRSGLPADVAAVRRALRDGLNQPYPHDKKKRKVGNATFGVYAFFDYDGEPIYVGQTYEGLRDRIGRHLTNQRTDPVAMHVLDPFEVLTVKLWPFFNLQDCVEALPAGSEERKAERRKAKTHLGKAEYTVYRKLLRASKYHAILNEKDVAGGPSSIISLPIVAELRIVPDEVYEVRKHPDVRIARRAATIANLAQVISERAVSKGLRRTMLTQARRLADLAVQRFKSASGLIPVETETEQDEV